MKYKIVGNAIGNYYECSDHRLSFIHKDNEIFVKALPGVEESDVVYMAAFEKIDFAMHGGKFFFPISWLQEKYILQIGTYEFLKDIESKLTKIIQDNSIRN